MSIFVIHRPSTLGLALSMAIALALIAHATATEVVFRETAQPTGGVVRLGDIAQVSSSASGLADGNALHRLREMPLMPAPAPNSQHEVSVRQVQDWLSMMGEDLTQFTFKGAPRVVISRVLAPVSAPAVASSAAPGRRIRTRVVPAGENSTGRLTNADVTKALTRKTPSWQARTRRPALITPTHRKRLNGQLEKAIAEHVQKISGEKGPWDIEVKAPLGSLRKLDSRKSALNVAGGDDPWVGSQQFSVLFNMVNSDGKTEVVGIEVPATVTRQIQVVVARQPIENGRIITAADVELKFVPSTNSFRRQTATNLEAVVGLVAKNNIQVGDKVNLATLQVPLLVRRGEAIEAIARGGGITVRTFMKSRNDGLAGDLIELETLESKERLYGRVVGRGKVEVFSGSP